MVAGLWCANQFDRDIQFHYQGQSRAILANPSHVVVNFSSEIAPKRSWREFLFHYSQMTYLLTTVLLLVVAYFFATGNFALRGDERLKAIEESSKSANELMQKCVYGIEQLQIEIRNIQKVLPSSLSGRKSKP